MTGPVVMICDAARAAVALWTPSPAVARNATDLQHYQGAATSQMQDSSTRNRASRWPANKSPAGAGTPSGPNRPGFGVVPSRNACEFQSLRSVTQADSVVADHLRGRLARAASPYKMAVAAGCCLLCPRPAVEPVALADTWHGRLARAALGATLRRRSGALSI